MNNSSRSGGIGFTGLLSLAFIVLKLTHYVAWSWWWVLSPIWLSAGIVVAFLIFCFLVIGVASFGERFLEERDRRKREERERKAIAEQRARLIHPSQRGRRS